MYYIPHSKNTVLYLNKKTQSEMHNLNRNTVFSTIKKSGQPFQDPIFRFSFAYFKLFTFIFNYQKFLH